MAEDLKIQAPIAPKPAPQPPQPGPAQSDAPKSKPKMAEGVVARGRTVLAPSDEQEVVGYKDDGTPRFRFRDREHGPGKTVRLPEGEIAHLMRAGFIEDPDAKVVEVATGPTLTNVPG